MEFFVKPFDVLASPFFNFLDGTPFVVPLHTSSRFDLFPFPFCLWNILKIKKEKRKSILREKFLLISHKKYHKFQTIKFDYGLFF